MEGSDDSRAMECDQVKVVGIGCRKDCAAEEIVSLVEQLLQECKLAQADVVLLATSWRKAGEKGITHAAETLKLPLVFALQPAMEAASDAAFTRSELVEKLFCIPSVSETAALAIAEE